MPARAIIGGDASEAAISAASILAKTARDAEMLRIHAVFPEYALDRHKGYDTAIHRAALRLHGPAQFSSQAASPRSRALLESKRMSEPKRHIAFARQCDSSRLTARIGRTNRGGHGRTLVGRHPPGDDLPCAQAYRRRGSCWSVKAGAKHAEDRRLAAGMPSGIECLSLRDGLFREISGVRHADRRRRRHRNPAGTGKANCRRATPCCSTQCRTPVTSVPSCAPPLPPGVRNVLLGPGLCRGMDARACCAQWTGGAHFALAIREQADLLAALASLRRNSDRHGGPWRHGVSTNSSSAARSTGWSATKVRDCRRNSAAAANLRLHDSAGRR
jgi:hypothetical protein